MKRLLTLFVALLGLVAQPALAEPEVFSKAGFKADQQAAIAGQKLQVAYFGATWCPPCKKMKAETWIDEKIESWADANAIVTHIDIDEEPALASQYRVRSIPTTVVIMGDKEIGRTVGYQSPDSFLSWLDGFRESHLDPARKAVGTPVKPAPSSDGDGSPMIAPAEAGAGISASEALKMYSSQTRADTTGLGVTGSLLLPRLAELANTDANLKADLAERVRMLTDDFTKGNVGVNDVREYLQLAPIAGLRDEAVAWMEAQLASPQTKDLIERNKQSAIRLLTEAGKYAQAGDLMGEPVRYVRTTISAANKAGAKAMKDLDGSLASAFESGQADLIRREIADAMAIAIVSGEEAKAKAIAKLFPGGEVSKAQDAVNAAAERAGVEPIQIAD